MNHRAVFALYPRAVTCDDGDGVRDVDGNRIEVDKDAIANWKDPKEYARKRAAAYPPVQEYLDAIVNKDQAQLDKYIADCLAVKALFPKPT